MILCVEVSVDPLEQVMRERARGRGEGGSDGGGVVEWPDSPHSPTLSLSSLSTRFLQVSVLMSPSEWEDRGGPG